MTISPAHVSLQFGRYETRERIPGGNQASEVYLAFDPELNREVVLKALSDAAADDLKTCQRFLQEAELLARMEHVAILPLYDFGFQDDRPYLVMRYMRGRSLVEKLASSGVLAPAEALRMLEWLGDALDYAHEKDLIHRDIKPQNILLDERGNAFLSDFGIATLVESQGWLTGNAMIGTVVFMSPEQAEGKILGKASDVYSFGLLAFFMLTGQVPYDYSEDASTAAIMYQHVHQQPSKLNMLIPALQPVIAKALEKAPEKRYQRASLFAAAFRKALDPALIALPMPARPTNLSAALGQVIWLCNYCGFSFSGAQRSCPICGHADLRRV